MSLSFDFQQRIDYLHDVNLGYYIVDVKQTTSRKDFSY